jgi:hypothetical protein
MPFAHEITRLERHGEKELRSRLHPLGQHRVPWHYASHNRLSYRTKFMVARPLHCANAVDGVCNDGVRRHSAAAASR